MNVVKSVLLVLFVNFRLYFRVNCLVFPTNQKIIELNEDKEIEDMITYHLYTENFTEELFTNDILTLTRSNFNRKLHTKFLIHDWLDDITSEWIQNTVEVMSLENKWNVILVNWSPLSYAFYPQALEHMILTSNSLVKFTQFLSTFGGQSLRSFHYIVHGYGLKIGVKVAKKLMDDDKFHRKIYRLTILDPLKELLNYGINEDFNFNFNYTDVANFVDVIHTSGGGFGNITTMGHVDFYPHGGKIQRGCATSYCSHIKVYEYWRKSIENPTLYKAYNYKSWDDFLDKKFYKLTPAFMGIAANKAIPSGNYYLET